MAVLLVGLRWSSSPLGFPPPWPVGVVSSPVVALCRWSARTASRHFPPSAVLGVGRGGSDGEEWSTIIIWGAGGAGEELDQSDKFQFGEDRMQSVVALLWAGWWQVGSPPASPAADAAGWRFPSLFQPGGWLSVASRSPVSTGPKH